MKVYPVVLAGGGGTRLWPLSREHYPKQFLALTGERSLLQDTLGRVEALRATDPEVGGGLIVCNEEHRFLVAEQARVMEAMPAAIVLEPVGRNTAPALTVSALQARAKGEDPVMLMMPADHLIEDPEAFAAAVAEGIALAESGRLVTFGVAPDRPETGYGYIAKGAALDGGACEIERFVEKPDRETAEQYLASGRYLWNSGIFAMKASVWLAAIEHFRPELARAAGAAHAGAAHDGDFVRLPRERFEACPSDSVDYAVMERLGAESGFEGAVVELRARWSDVGSWDGLWQITEHDGDGNLIRGDVVALDSRDNVVFSNYRLVATLGCEDMVVVETADAVLVAPRARTQELRRLVAHLNEADRSERLMHRRVYRPWGSYEGVDTGERFQVKRIIVNPGHSLSLQMHHHRAEHWIVVRGTALVTRDGEETMLSENESTYIPIGVTHRLANPGVIPLEIIEVQSGAYLGEDDIVRFEDAYDRHCN